MQGEMKVYDKEKVWGKIHFMQGGWTCFCSVKKGRDEKHKKIMLQLMNALVFSDKHLVFTLCTYCSSHNPIVKGLI